MLSVSNQQITHASYPAAFILGSMEASTSSEAEAPGVSESEESEDSQLSLQEDPEEVTPSVSVHNLLDRLKCPKSSDLSRKRKIRSNPPKGKKRSKGAVATEPKSVAPSQRVKEFSNECLKVNLGKMTAGRIFH